VGRSLCAQLIRAGFAVRVATRNRQRSRRLLVLPGIELVELDVHDRASLAYFLTQGDAAVNLVGILNERAHDGSGFHKVHVELAEKLVGACLDARVPRILSMSALKANPDRGPSHYLRTKGQAEQALKTLCDDAIHYTIFRPSVIFGAEDTFLNRFAKLLRIAPVLPMPQLNARFAPVHVEDVAAAYVRALEDSSTFGRTYELCGPDIYTLEEILTFIKRELGIRRLVLPLPMPLGRIQAWIADYLIPGKPFSLDNLRSLTVANVCSENGLQSLGIKPAGMQTIARGFLRRGPGELARLRKRTVGR
jgi:NADH dehydrogenase